jgi:DNA-directed RNA polymerase subunit RPC12/RpoP
MENAAVRCIYCNSQATVKFPCCGYLCMKCGKSFDEIDIENKDKERPLHR